MFTITRLMLCMALPLFGFLGYRALQQLRNNVHFSKEKMTTASNFTLYYLALGLLLFFTTLFDTAIGKVIFDFYWGSAMIFGFFYSIKERSKNPLRSFLLLLLSYVYLLFLPYLILFSGM